jgi:ATP-dependent DNA helicase RecQ
MDKYEVLRQFFGHDTFRPGQEQLVDGILQGRDVLGIMPTGGGKSLCYQVPALLLPGLTVVVSPLISLMQDQVSALTANGVPAAFLNSALSPAQRDTVAQRLLDGAYRLLYVAPERLESAEFRALLPRLSVSLVAVDEAHCISQWGQDFRPSYLKIPDFLALLPQRPVVAAFTATATETVREDIRQLLGLRDPVQVVTGFDWPNLFFDVQKPKNKLTALTALLADRREKSGIVYCATRSAVESVCDALTAQGFSATRYHAGLSEAERQENQNDFQFDRRRIMVATNAFGMGIDKSNVSFVIHYQMPKSPEAYYQEAGRAGRDGSPAECILLYSAGDVTTAKFLIENSGGNDQLTEEEQAIVRQQDYLRLDSMVRYCRSSSCYRGQLLDYFGQAHDAACGNCGNCQAELVDRDITREAQMILSCVQRVRKHLGYTVGAALIGQVLGGSKNQRVMELDLNTLPTYGVMKGTTQGEIRHLIEVLEADGYLRTNVHGGLDALAPAAQVLFHGQTVTMAVRKEAVAEPEATPARRRPAAAAPVESGLLAALKAERLRLAQEERVPAYIVFSNATLADMAVRHPRTLAEFLEVSGVGQTKASRYGAAFLAVLNAYSEDEA